MKRAWEEAWPASLLTAALMTFVHLFRPNSAPLGVDGRYYLAMAAAPLANTPMVRSIPYCWRLLTPTLVHILPFGGPHGFLIVTFVCVSLTPIPLAWFLSGLPISSSSRRGATVLFALTGSIVGGLAADPLLVDGPAFFLLTIACAAYLHRNKAALFIAMLLLAATKETAVMAVVFAGGWAFTTKNREDRRLAAVGSALAIAVLIGVRLAVSPLVSFGYLEHARHLYWPLSARTIGRRLLLSTASTWNVLLPIAALQFVDRPRVWRSPAFVLPSLAALFQITFQLMTERVVISAFPFVFAAVALEVDLYCGNDRRREIACWTALGLAQIPWFLEGAGFGAVPHMRAFEMALIPATVIACVWRRRSGPAERAAILA